MSSSICAHNDVARSSSKVSAGSNFSLFFLGFCIFLIVSSQQSFK